MHATVDSAIHVATGTLSAKVEALLTEALSFANPAFAERRRLGASTFNVPERLCFLSHTADGLRLPRGAVDVLKRFAPDSASPPVRGICWSSLTLSVTVACVGDIVRPGVCRVHGCPCLV